MKMIKKVIYIVVIAIISLIIYSTFARATITLKVTADTLNLREKTSTSSDIVTLLSKGDTCELIEEDGDWYKVKYKTYTGYVSKEYVKKQDSSTNQATSNDKEAENTKNNNNSEVDDSNTNSVSDDAEVQVTGKIAKKTALKLVPLIYSTDIDSLSKNEKVIVISELNGWSYIQTEKVTGWVRSDIITGKQSISNGSTNNAKNDNEKITDNNDTDNKDDVVQDTNNKTSDSYKEKTMYINDSYVNVRKEPNTSSEIVMVLALNTKLTVIGESGEWYKVKTSEGNAYVSKELLSSKQITTSRGTTKKVVSNSSDNIADTAVVSNTTQKSTESSSNTTQKVSTSISTKGQQIVDYAKQFLGVPYVYGGASKSGFDCSGFTMYVYKKFGISMAHGAQAQSKLGKAVSANKNSSSSLKQNLQLGDLVFFLDYETMDEIGHCGIYIGNGKFIHVSSGSGYCVKIDSLLPGNYYNTRYCAARRVI